ATILALFPLLGAGLLGVNMRQGRAGASLWMLGIYAAFGMAAYIFSNRYLRSEHPLAGEAPKAGPVRAEQIGAVKLIGRRGVARWTFYAILGVAAYDIGRALLDPLLRLGAGRVRRGTGVFPSIDGLATEGTSASDFYEVSKNASDPDVDIRRWRLQVGGLVQ